MKTKYILFLAIAGLLTATSCKKTFFTSVNKDVNAPPAVPPSSLLSTVEAGIGYTQGGDMSRFTSLFTQQTFGAGRQSQAYYEYVFTGQDVDDLWGNTYVACMENDKTLMQLADSKGYNAYSGVSRLLMAYTLSLTVDLWNNVPYSTANQGAGNLHPTYDNGAGLYDTVISLTNEAIAYLNNSDPGALVPGGEDVVYGGSETEWIKFGHALLGRIYTHLGKSNAANATTALNQIAQAFSANTDNAQYIFGTTETSANPWYEFNEQRGTDIGFENSTLAVWMDAHADPRYLIYVDTADGGTGGPNGLDLGAYYGSINSPVEFITYDEMLYDKTLDELRAGSGTPTTDYSAAITANMTKLGVASGDITTFITAHPLPVAAADAEDTVGFQAWLGLYLNPEAWSFYRMTNSPNLVPVGGTNGVPRRLLYPNTEIVYNGSNVPSATLYAPRIFWDN